MKLKFINYKTSIGNFWHMFGLRHNTIKYNHVCFKCNEEKNTTTDDNLLILRERMETVHFFSFISIYFESLNV